VIDQTGDVAAAWLWARSEWRRRWASLALVAVLVALAGGLTIAGVVGARRADTSFTRFVDQTGDPEITVDAFDLESGWDPGQVERGAAAFAQSAAIPGVIGAQRISAFAVAVGDNPDAFSFALLEETGPAPEPLLVSGRRFDLGDSTEVMLNESAADVFGLGAGDQVELRSVGWDRLDEYLSQDGAFVEKDGPTLTATITGVQRTAVDMAQQDDPFVLLSPAFAEQYADRIVNCACLSMYDVEPDRAEPVVAELARIYEPLGFNVGLEEEGSLPANIAKGIDIEVTTLWLLALAAGVAGLVMVGQAMARQAAEGADDRSTGAALGATTGQLTAAGVTTLAPAVLAGAIGALVVAVVLSPLTPRGLARLAEVDPGVWIDGAALGVGALAIIAVGTILLVATARWTVRRTSRQPQRLAALPSGLGASGLLGVGFAIRPGRRGRAAAGAALMATAIGVGGLIGVWAFEAGRTGLIQEGRLFGVDADLAWRGEVEDLAPAVELTEQTQGVEAIGVRRRLDVELELSTPNGSAEVFPGSLEPLRGWAGPTVVHGRRAEGSDEVVLGRQLLADLDVEVGDTVDVAAAAATTTLTVVGEVVAWDVDEVDRGVEMTPAGLDRLAETVCSDDVPCTARVEYLVARTGEGAAGERARQELLRSGFISIPLPSEVDNLEQAGALPWVLATFLGVLGIAGILHALVTVARRRRRDIVIARALGLSSRGARAAIRWSAATMGTIGLVVGIPLGIVVGRLVWAATARGLGAVVEQALPWWAPVLAIAGALAITLALAELPARRTARARPAETLRTE
jgi:hypothetical protein